MKFRQYVGEKPRKVKDFKDIKKIIQTDIGPTEKDFLEIVARKKPLIKGNIYKERKRIETQLGFGLSKKHLKRVFDYIKSWLIRYDVPFKPINPYLTVYLLDNLPSVSVFIDNIKNTKRGMIYKPKGTITIISPNERDFPRSIMEPERNKDQILLDYIPNSDYHDVLENVFDAMGIKIIDKYCHVKLFEIESGIFTPQIYRDMMYSAPKMPDLRLGNIGLRRMRYNGNI